MRNVLRALRRRLVGFEPVTVVTSFHAEGYRAYGQRFLATFEEHWPRNVRLKVYAENVDVAAHSTRVEVIPLLEAVPALRRFRDLHQSADHAHGLFNGTYDYRYDAVKFANKAFALAHAARHCSTPLLAWLDADVVSFRPIPADFIARVLGEGYFVAYLGRLGHHTETGFLAFDLTCRAAREFFSAYESMYTSGEIFRLREWHDCEVFDVVRATFAAQGKIRTRNLSPEGASHPFVNSVLGEYMDHLKGPVRKQAGRSLGEDYLYYRGIRLPPPPANLSAGRYGYIAEIVRFAKPTTIVEVGTWSGHRAMQMASAALAEGRPVHYEGFDLFEDATPTQDAAEKNVKPHYAQAQVQALLDRFGAQSPGFSFELTKGDTREVLQQTSVDLAFIDGGHSVETIRSDFERLRASRIIVLDDWYGGDIDTRAFGCNRVIEAEPHIVLPHADPVAGGGLTHLAVVAAPEILEALKEHLKLAITQN